MREAVGDAHTTADGVDARTGLMLLLLRGLLLADAYPSSPLSVVVAVCRDENCDSVVVVVVVVAVAMVVVFWESSAAAAVSCLLDFTFLGCFVFEADAAAAGEGDCAVTTIFSTCSTFFIAFSTAAGASSTPASTPCAA